MKRLILSWYLIILAFGFCTKLYGQDSSIHIFLGGSVNYLGITHMGWGAEVGARLSNLYIGVEYGNYGYAETDPDLAQQTFPKDGSILDEFERGAVSLDPHYSISREYYLSLTGGVIVANLIWLGYSAIISYQNYIHPVFGFGGDSYTWEKSTSYYFDIGPDVRIEAWNHLLFNFSYSYRRGIKSGLGYLF